MLLMELLLEYAIEYNVELAIMQSEHVKSTFKSFGGFYLVSKYWEPFLYELICPRDILYT